MKRFADLLGALILLGIFLIPMAIVALLVAFFLGRPVIFRQRRPGLKGKPFEMLKFRTMTNALDRHGKLLSDAERLPKFGRMLRMTSLDELPELLNVLRGDMSLVGPRPLLMQYLDRYSAEQARRHEVLPGITGWAQVHGRNAISWERKFELDVWYVENRTLMLDLRILAMTVVKVMKRDGISAKNSETIDEFLGAKGVNQA